MNPFVAESGSVLRENTKAFYGHEIRRRLARRFVRGRFLLWARPGRWAPWQVT